MTVTGRVRAAVGIIALGIVAYISWPSIGSAFEAMQYTTWTAMDFANAACDPVQPTKSDYSVYGPDFSGLPPCPGGQRIAPSDDDPWNLHGPKVNPIVVSRYLAANAAELNRRATVGTDKSRSSAIHSTVVYLEEPLRAVLLVVAIAVAAIVLVPAILPTRDSSS